MSIQNYLTVQVSCLVEAPHTPPILITGSAENYEIVTIQPKGGTHLFQAKNGDFAFPTVISGVKVRPT